MIRSKNSVSVRFISTCGSKYENDYKVVYDDKGFADLKVCGRHNVYNKIQSYADDVDIYKIIGRYFNGDVSVLDKNKGFYADLTQIPKNYNDFHNKIVEGQNLFASLPTDFKARFGNSVNAFVNAIYDNSLEKHIEDYRQSKQVKNDNLAVDFVPENSVKVGDDNGK